MSTKRWPLLTVVVACTGAGAQQPAEQRIIESKLAVYKPMGFYEYTKDGSAILGMANANAKGGKVLFTTCDGKSREVDQSALRSSKARCEIRWPGTGMWGSLDKFGGPVFKVANDASNTKVTYHGQTIDLAKVQGWETADTLPAVFRADEPVGMVFQTMKGDKGVLLFVVDRQPSPKSDQ